MIVSFKGKGILVPIYAVACFVGSIILLKLIEENFFEAPLNDSVYGLSFGISLIATGYLTRMIVNEHYVNSEGEKVYYDFDHRFMWLHIRIWVYILWLLGAFFGLAGLIGLF